MDKNTVTIPAASMPLVREALRMQLLSVMEDLQTCLTTGEPDLSSELVRFDEVRHMLREVDGEADIEMRLDGRRATMFAEALRRELETARDLANTHDGRQRKRAEADAATIERLLPNIDLNI